VRLVSTLLLLLLAACADPLAAARKAAADQHAKAAEAALKQGDLTRAQAAAQLALQYDPLDPKRVDESQRVALAVVAVAGPGTPPDQLARADYQAEALEPRDPQWAHVYRTVRGWAAFGRGDLKDAEAHLREAEKQTADYAPAQLGLALVLDAKGDKAGARAAAEKATKLAPKNVLAASTLGKLLVEAGEYPRAIAVLNGVVGTADNATARVNLGFALAKTGQVDQAAQQYERALVLEPTNTTARYRLAETYVSLGKLDDAKRAFEKAAAQGAEPWATRGLGAIAAQQGDHKAALEAFEKVLQSQPNDLETLFKAAEQHEALNEKGKAAALYQRFAEVAQQVPSEKERALIARDRASRLGGAVPAPPPGPPPPGMAPPMIRPPPGAPPSAAPPPTAPR